MQIKIDKEILMMGDFERTFGAGADADSIIFGYSGGAEDTSKIDKIKINNFEKRKRNEYISEIKEWRSNMKKKGYEEGPIFSSYNDLSEWDKKNKRSHIRRPSPYGYEVFFTDKK